MLIFKWLDEIFDALEKKYPYKQSYKVTPEYIVEQYKHAKLPDNDIDFSDNYYWEFNRIRAKWGIKKN